MTSVKTSMDFTRLQARYREGSLTVSQWVEEVRRRVETYPDPAVWINLLSWDSILERAWILDAAWRAESKPLERFPLFGLPFAVKDNIDVAGTPTTAACPDFAYAPARHAAAVERLVSAGALLIGKTNLDQFATGLVGTRSPFGAVRNVFNPEYISGGSSSGSAVAVAAGLVSFALGTDTAGSGRVPAGFNNIVGLKPTRGLVSARGVVPACRSLDCVSVFALTCEDAFRVLETIRGEDPEDAYSHHAPEERSMDTGALTLPPGTFRFAVPDSAGREFFGDAEYSRLFEKAISNLTAMGGIKSEVPMEDFFAAARLLYQGPWVSERWASFGEFMDRNPTSVLPVIREVVGPGRSQTAESAFRAQYRMQELKARSHRLLAQSDFLVLPTAPTHYRQAEVSSDPIVTNSRLGTYTNFVNLLDLAALSVPAGFQSNGLPFGITLVSLPYREGYLSSVGTAFHRRQELPLGISGHTHPPFSVPRRPEDSAALAVAGLHLSGQPLNGQLLELGARLRGTYKTAPLYRLYALRRGERHFPGLVRQPKGGAELEVEVWDLSRSALGRFLRQVKAPLAIGTVDLSGGESVAGFLCESYAIEDAEDITHFGGWLAYRRNVV